ncbi:MAG: hypothetical protein ACXVDA_06690 [Ktedonobacterales bacterium]
MSKLPAGLGVIKGLTGLLATTRGAVLSVVVTSVIIAAAGFGFWYMRDAAPTSWLAGSVPTATALPTSIPTLAPTATPTLAPTATPTLAPTATLRPAVKPVPTVARDPQLSTTPLRYVYETTCGEGVFTPSGVTVKNTGGGTLTWQATISTDVTLSNPPWLEPSFGSLAAGQAQQVMMKWISTGEGVGAIPPAGSIPVTFTSNGGDQQVFFECPPS